MIESMLALARQAHLGGVWDEALAHYEAGLAEARTMQRHGDTADILRFMGEVCRERGQIAEAVGMFEESRSTAEAAGLTDRAAFAMNSLAVVQTLRGDLPAAMDLYLQVRSLAEGLEDETLLAVVDQNLGTIANMQGNAAVALLSYRSALQRYRKLGDAARSSRALNNMGMAHVDLGEWQAAERSFAEAAELAEASGEIVMVGRVELNRAELHLRRYRYEQALEAVERSLEIFQRLRVKPSIGEAYKFYGILYRKTGKARQADTHFGLALSLADACDNRLLQAEVQLEWALLHLEEERREEGILYMNRALTIFRGLQAEGQVLDVERRLEALREIYLPAVHALGASRGECGDPHQTGHAQRVADHATKLAREMGMDGWDLTWLQIGALVHGIGNGGMGGELPPVPEREEARDVAERRVHAVLGEALVRQLEFPEEVRRIVRCQSEHWSGNGAPDRLAGEEIPVGARIVAIADCYDSLTSSGSHRPEYSSLEALEIMARESAHRFDPKMWPVFRDMLLRDGLDQDG